MQDDIWTREKTVLLFKVVKLEKEKEQETKGEQEELKEDEEIEKEQEESKCNNNKGVDAAADENILKLKLGGSMIVKY